MSEKSEPDQSGQEETSPRFRIKFRWYGVVLVGLLVPTLAAHFGYLPQIILPALIPVLFFAFPAWLLSLVFAIVGRLRGKM
ncbi:MAG: hypothetical protein GXP01_11470 [Alphaproteobacteria bacterium]|nr:hypothetical protein [Alphaproteobacteria bacterium]